MFPLTTDDLPETPEACAGRLEGTVIAARLAGARRLL